jgi:hypothetical protein
MQFNKLFAYRPHYPVTVPALCRLSSSSQVHAHSLQVPIENPLTSNTPPCTWIYKLDLHGPMVVTLYTTSLIFPTLVSDRNPDYSYNNYLTYLFSDVALLSILETMNFSVPLLDDVEPSVEHYVQYS